MVLEAIAFQPIVVSLGVGGIVGFAMGAFLRHAIKWIAIFGGFVIALLAYLQYEKLVSVDWQGLGNRSYEAAIQAATKTQEIVYTVSDQYDTNAVTFAGIGFMGGLALGWKV